MIWKRKI